MPTVNMHEAKTNLSKLVQALVSGAEEEIIISRNGEPAVRMVPIQPERKPRRLGLAKGKIKLVDDFDRDNKLIEALFEGADPA